MKIEGCDLANGGPFGVSGTERLCLDVRMRKLGIFSDDRLKSSVTPITVVVVPLLGGEVFSYMGTCAFLEHDEDPGIGKVHGVGRVGGGGLRRSVLEVDGVL